MGRNTFFFRLVLFLFLFSCKNSANKKEASADSTNLAKKYADSIAALPPTYPDLPTTVTLKTLRVKKHNDGLLKLVDKQDEVYLLLAGKKSEDTADIKTRFPYGLSWSLSDKGGPARQAMEVKYRPEKLWDGILIPGEAVELTFVMMEEDKAKAADRLELASQLARKTKPEDTKVGTAAAVSDIAARIFRTNKDDFIGAFAVKISNVKGEKKTEWKIMDFCSDEGSDSTGKKFDVHGAGAHYSVTLDVQ